MSHPTQNLKLETRNSKLSTVNRQLSTPLRIVIAAGGTGGHLFPGLAVAREFQVSHGGEVTFFTSPKSITAQILERHGFAWEAVTAEALKGRKLLGRVQSLAKIPGAIRQARARLQDLQPGLVLGMGGYSSGPVGVAAWRLGIPLAIHEQNAIPGAANRWLARLARRIFVSFPMTRSYLPPDKVMWTGNPIREEFFRIKAERPERPFTVLVTGGSQGAHHLNMETLRALPRLADIKEQLHFLHLTGEADFEEVEAGYREKGWTAEVAAFTKEMPEWMSRAHLVVSRAGASTLAELAAVGRAALLVPYPFAAGNHQEFNARFLAEAGAGEIILNKDFTGALLTDRIRQLMEQPGKRTEMEVAARRLAKPDAAKEIVEGCLGLI